MAGFHVERLTSNCGIATARNLLLYRWRDAPLLEDVREIGRISRALEKRYSQGTASMHLVVSGSPRFTDDMRAEATRVRADPRIAPLGSAEIVLVAGFAGIAVRGFFSTASLLSRSTRPTKVFSDLATASLWLAPKLASKGEPWTPAEVVALAEEFLAAP